MAKNGLSTFLHATLAEDGTYGAVTKLAGAIAYKETINLNSYKHYEDNVLQWEDNSFKDGALNLTIGDDDKAIFSALLGRGTKTLTVGGVTKTVYAGSVNDISIPVGFGFIENIRTKAGFKYGVKFYLSVTFKPYATEGNTKNESNTYTTQAVDGTISTVGAEYIFDQRFDTMNEAITTLYTCFGKAVPATVLNTDLSTLTIGDLALSPSFNASVLNYVAVTTNLTSVITVAKSDPVAAAVIKRGTTVVANEASTTWAPGQNIVTVAVVNGTATKTYTVVVTKS